MEFNVCKKEEKFYKIQKNSVIKKKCNFINVYMTVSIQNGSQYIDGTILEGTFQRLK